MTKSELKERLTETIALLRIPGVGRGRFHKLVKAFGTPGKVLEASVSRLETFPGVSHTIASDIHTRQDLEEARQIASRVIQLGWSAMFPGSPEFPASLLNLPQSDIPPLLFRSGDAGANEKAIAIVGTRHPSEHGRMFAYNLAKALVEAGIVVVSGMAEGIDAAAHKGALDAGGVTIAVWGNSLDKIYPPSNKKLAEQIIQHGAAYSEYLPDTAPDRSHFPERNRIISGLSDGVVVVEAGRKSGALITASQALIQQRELFAVPGPPNAKSSEGANALIKQGARLLTSIEDIFEELPRLKGEVVSRRLAQLPEMTEVERKIVNLLAEGPKQVDYMSREVNLSVPEMMEYLLALELKNIVKELSGKRYILAEDYA